MAGTSTGWPSMTTSTAAGSGRGGGDRRAAGTRRRAEPEGIVAHRECSRSGIGSSVANADSMAFDAVWPSPQIEASRITWPISLSKASSSARPPIGRPDRSRCNSSSCRTVPTRQGTHWPHDSSRKKAAIRSRMSPRSIDSSKTSTTPEPSDAPRRARALEGQGDLQLVRPDEHSRGAAEQHRADRLPVRDSAGQRDQVAER